VKRIRELASGRYRLWIIGSAAALCLLLGGAAFVIVREIVVDDPRSPDLMRWFSGDAEAQRELITVQRETCPGAPFLLPADGYIGLLYGDPRGPYTAERRHQGIDIFSPADPGVVPVLAAYDGYLTREVDWLSSLIIRVPDDPLQPGRQIWLYYTHMANTTGTLDYIDDAFPPGTREAFVRQGTLLGYTGDYGGGRPVAVHLHFSIVLDEGGQYRNELEFSNTVDPSRYLGMAVNYGCAERVPACTGQPSCAGTVLGAGGG